MKKEKTIKKRVRSKKWWDMQEKDEDGDVCMAGSRVAFVEGMTRRCGEVLTLEPHCDGTYREEGDPYGFVWEDWMFEDWKKKRPLEIRIKKTGRLPWTDPGYKVSIMGTGGELEDAIPELLDSCVDAGVIRGALIANNSGETASVGKPPCYCEPKGESPLDTAVGELERLTKGIDEGSPGGFKSFRIAIIKEIIETAVKMGDIKGATIEDCDGKMIGYGTGKSTERKKASKKKAIEK